MQGRNVSGIFVRVDEVGGVPRGALLVLFFFVVTHTHTQTIPALAVNVCVFSSMQVMLVFAL